MTELEEQLALPTGETLRQSLLQQLDGVGLRLRTQLQAGVPRKDYADWQAAADAVSAAQEVLQNARIGAPQGSL
ncbi:MAG: Type secretion system, cytoplasmic component of needle [Proteobacteria bacterium]|nr:Type secretion system, cytoplasmic component of needle [Pseudomonadota bacterium]